MPLTFHTTDAPEVRDLIKAHVRAYNVAQIGASADLPINITVRDETETLMGGITGWVFWDCFHIEYLWVAEAHRGQGVGTQLLQHAEVAAQAHGCRQIFVDTFEFQAPAFYTKHGYALYGTAEGYAGRYRRFYFQKSLPWS